MVWGSLPKVKYLAIASFKLSLIELQAIKVLKSQFHHIVNMHIEEV